MYLGMESRKKCGALPSERTRKPIPLPFPTFLSRWFSELPVWWDMFSRSLGGTCLERQLLPALLPSMVRIHLFARIFRPNPTVHPISIQTPVWPPGEVSMMKKKCWSYDVTCNILVHRNIPGAKTPCDGWNYPVMAGTSMIRRFFI